LEERGGERRPTIIEDAVRGDIPPARRQDRSGVPAENNDLLSLSLSSRG